jgi:RNA polymerase sigma-70 factor (ECF subfamily)
MKEFFRTNEPIEEVYHRFSNTVFRIALMMLRNSLDAEDVAQTVFIQLMKTEKAFESDEHIKAWLIVTTQNTCRNILKGWWWSKRVDSEEVLRREYQLDTTDFEIHEKLSKLPGKLKIPLYLHYFEGYKTEEIAKILGINPSTVRTQMRTARKKLKLLLEEDI